MKFYEIPKEYPFALRKAPQQQRSQFLVDSILEATVKVFEDSPEEDMVTTKSVASTAGVAIGSLYQYFPNKQSIVAKLIEAIADDFNKKIIKRLDRQNPKTLEEMVDAMIDLVFELFWRKRILFRHLFRLVHQLDRVDYIHEKRAEIVKYLNQLCIRNNIAISRPNQEFAIYIAANLVMGLIEACVCQRITDLNEQEVRAEMRANLLNYLR